MLACALGFVGHRMWQWLPAARFGESLVLALLWLALAWGVARVARRRVADGIALVGLVALVTMAGPLPVLATALLVAAAIGIGTCLIDDVATAFVVGAAAIAGVVGWLLPLPIHSTWLYVVVLGAITVLRRRAVRAAVQTGFHDWRASLDAAPRAWSAAALAVALASAGTWLPTLQYDDLAYHLGLPWQLMEHGRYALDASQQVWALAPWAGDVLQGLAQLMARQEARGAVDAVWLLAIAIGAYRLAASLGASATMRALAVAMVATLPPIAALAGSMHTELPASAALLALATLAVAPRDSRRALIAIALLAGFLAGLKSIHFVAGLPLVALAAWRHRRGARANTFAVAAFGFLLVAASSYTYATLTCGNPVLPLLNGVFHSPCFATTNFEDPRWHRVAGVPLPWSMTFLTSAHLEGWNGGLGFALIALSGAAMVALIDRRTRALAACALFAVVAPMALIAYARYVVPGLVVLVPIAVVAMANVLPPWRAALLGIALCALDLAFQANAHWIPHTGGIKRALVAGGRDAPLFARYAPERLAIERLRVLAPQATVLDLGAATHAELAGRGRTTLWYAPSLNTAALGADRDPTGATWADLLRDAGIDVVLMRTADATPARRAGLVQSGAHPLLTVGPVECWRLPRPGTR
ncbi:hypothetical protein DWG18_10805 [Lysobacter sp. TY2-98]|uniref:hypothetical protein n=1 Tax=Lysobacter sp. TY2-98 TaxID=2290922 RepID=UPI000E2030BD|nr:hypothetical protein [Lysobacter sp. TY2-98]AXK72715.1 hypothetical protein DWG18_10805 [Lysobacter sp. TY2-98]